MGKTNDSNHAHVVIFVEGDTDELFFKALVEHYRQHSDTPLLPCRRLQPERRHKVHKQVVG